MNLLEEFLWHVLEASLWVLKHSDSLALALTVEGAGMLCLAESLTEAATFFFLTIKTNQGILLKAALFCLSFSVWGQHCSKSLHFLLTLRLSRMIPTFVVLIFL